jgi:hypothetical protein
VVSDTLKPGYEIEPSPLGSSTRRTAVLVATALIAFLAVVLIKPWAGPSTPPGAAPAIANASAMVRPAAPAVANSTVPPTATPSKPWPAIAVGPAAGSAPAPLDLAKGQPLVVYSGAWGVGDGGSGPRLIRDEPWFDWAPVVPQPSTEVPDHVGVWPGTGVCAGLPVLFDRPSFVAVTVPGDLTPAPEVAGWWSDGWNAADLAGSIRQVSPAGTAGISYLVRLDGAIWPSGRYELHVTAGRRTVSMTVCLARTT